MRQLYYGMVATLYLAAPLCSAAEETVGQETIAPAPTSVLSELPGASNAEPKTEDQSIYTTKKLPFAKASPPGMNTKPEEGVGAGGAKAPAANAAPTNIAPTPASAAPIPFGKSTAVMDKQFVTGPKSISAVPVENVDAIETGEPAPAEPAENVANPAKEDPAQPTQLTAPIFTPQSSEGIRSATIRVLNKVTARAEKIELKPDQVVSSGKLLISASHCQHSDPSSLPDDAVLVNVSEVTDAKSPAKPLFTGWIYQSSPSINALENPIYDVSLVSCNDAVKPAAPKMAISDKKGKKS